jgi:hypothetical protein
MLEYASQIKKPISLKPSNPSTPLPSSSNSNSESGSKSKNHTPKPVSNRPPLKLPPLLARDTNLDFEAAFRIAEEEDERNAKLEASGWDVGPQGFDEELLEMQEAHERDKEVVERIRKELRMV